MAAGDTDIGTGTAITFGGNTTLTAELMGASLGGVDRGSIDLAHMGITGARKFIPADTFDPGEWTFEFNFKDNELPDFDDSSAAQTVTITMPGGHTWVASMFPTGFDATIPFDDKMTSSYVFKVSEETTVAPGA